MMDGTQAFTTLHFALMALLAVLVIVAIAVGVRKQRGRAAAEREVEAHAAEAGVELASPAPEVPAPAPLAPAPPPIVDQPAPGTPPPFEEPAPRPIADQPAPASPLADKPIAAVVAPEGATATIAADAVVTESSVPAEGPVTQLKGLGPKVAARLGELGIDRVGQLAQLDDGQAAEVDARMGPFAGRLARDRWIEQARLLAAGDRDGFERVFGRL